MIVPYTLYLDKKKLIPRLTKNMVNKWNKLYWGNSLAFFQAAIRNAEVEKAKAEARLAKLREGGISVDEYIDAFVYTAEQVQGRP